MNEIYYSSQALLILYLTNVPKRQCQQQRAAGAPPQQYDPITNIIEPISTSQPFNQYSFKPQATNLTYPIALLPVTQPVTPYQTQTPFSTPTNHPPPRVISTNIPVYASYQVASQPIVSAAHAYPVQHSVEINHGDYDWYPNTLLQQHTEPAERRNIAPITRPTRPQYSAPIAPFKQYNQGAIKPQQSIGPKPVYQPPINQQPFQQILKPFLAPTINQNVNIKRPIQPTKAYISNQNTIPQVTQKQYLPVQQSTPPNLPYGFKPIPVASTYLPPNNQNANPNKLIPKPLPSPLTNLVTARPLPVPISRKPEVKEEDSEEDEKPRREPDRKPVREEEEEEESEEDDESEEEDDEDSEASYERDYRPRYNYHEDNDYDRKRYRPTFDAAKYIFNDSEEDDRESEEDERREERRPPPSRHQYRERDQDRRKKGPYREDSREVEHRKPQKNPRPHYKRVASGESQEQEAKNSRWVPVRQNRRYKGYYK